MLVLKQFPILLKKEKNGKYKSFIDFIKRVSAKDVNKLQLKD